MTDLKDMPSWRKWVMAAQGGDTMMDEQKPCQEATPHATLEEQILGFSIPKSEREWWAQQEILKLRAALAAKDEELAWWNGLVKRNCIGTKETPSLKAYVEQLEQELARVTTERDEYRTLNEHHKDEFLTANLKLARIEQQLDTLLAEAVKWAQMYMQESESSYARMGVLDPSKRDVNYVAAQAFLARPDVREWLERQKGV